MIVFTLDFLQNQEFISLSRKKFVKTRSLLG